MFTPKGDTLGLLPEPLFELLIEILAVFKCSLQVIKHGVAYWAIKITVYDTLSFKIVPPLFVKAKKYELKIFRCVVLVRVR